MLLSSHNIPGKQEIFKKTFDKVSASMRILSVDDARPWGGFFVIDECHTHTFIKRYFPNLFKDLKQAKEKLSPKILLVAPGMRLSWQYHHRRAEIWRVLDGDVRVITSDTDEEKNHHTLRPGDVIELQQGERHRLVGLSDWGVVAEIWKHTQPENPSDEEDIIRLQDDFGR